MEPSKEEPKAPESPKPKKEPKRQAPNCPTLAKMIENSIPVVSADFHAAVNNGNKTPENAFNEESGSAERRVEMWLTPSGSTLICWHKGKYFFVPAASVKFGYFK